MMHNVLFYRPTVGHRRSFSTDEDPSLDGRKRHRSRSSPSEKARFHFHYRVHLSALSVGKEMSLGDPHYRPRYIIHLHFEEVKKISPIIGNS